MPKLIKLLDKHFEEFLLVLLLLLIACVEMLQVVLRNLSFVPSLLWAEEFCRFCWIATVFISLPYTIRHGLMLRVNLLGEMLRGRSGRLLNFFVNLFTAAALTLLAYHSVGVVNTVYASGETSPAMRLPMWLLYGLMLFSFVLGILRALQSMILSLKPDSGEGSNECLH